MSATPDSPAWEVTALSKRADREALIPEAWRLPESAKTKYGGCPISIFAEPLDPAVCPGILSSHELDVTDRSNDATRLLRLLKQGQVSSVELVTAFCKRAAVAHQLTNCLTEIMFDKAIQQAKEIDAGRESDQRPLAGLPITFKDNFFIQGYDASMGIASQCFQPATKNSQLVDISQSLGAIIIAKTTVPQTMLTADTDSVVFGRTCNANNSNLAAAGSSGGEGVVIAMGGSALGFGTDGAGSVRMPAFVNGVVGYKPSGYRLPMDTRPIMRSGVVGTTALGPVSVAGILARSVRDAVLMTQLISEAEPWQTNPFLLPSPWLDLRLPASSPLRIGVWADHDHLHLLPPVARVFRLAQERLKAAGHVLVPFQGPALGDVWSLLKEWTEIQDLRPLRKLLSQEPITPIVKNTLIIEPENKVPDLDLDRLHYMNKRIASLVTGMASAWNNAGIDALLWVPAPHPAMPFDMYTEMTLTALCNVIDWPAVVIPTGDVVMPNLDFSQDLKIPDAQLYSEADRTLQAMYFSEVQSQFSNLPLSIQIIGRRGQDEKMLKVAEVLQPELQTGGNSAS